MGRVDRLSAAGVIALFCIPLAFPRNANAARVTDGLIALYVLDEGSGTTVYDTSGFGEPLDLAAIAAHQGTKWNWMPGGIEFIAPTIIQSAVAATKISDRLRTERPSGGGITIEAWVVAADRQGAVQNPAEIVTMGQGTSNTFSLFQVSEPQNSQIGDAFGGYENDHDFSLLGPASVVSGKLQHVVYTQIDAIECCGSHYPRNIYIDLDKQANDSIFTHGGFHEAYPLSLANRAEGARPWLGQIHLVAIYDRALSLDEIRQNFVAGVPEPITISIGLSGFAVSLVHIMRRRGRASLESPQHAKRVRRGLE